MKKNLIPIFAFGLFTLVNDCLAQPGHSKDVIPHVRQTQRTAKGHLYAIIIGISHYDDSLHISQLHYAEKDAAHFLDFLKNGYLAHSTYNEHDILYIPQKDATQEYIVNKVNEWFNNLVMKDNDELFIYFSGHGLTYKEQQFLVCKNTTNPYRNSGLGRLYPLSQVLDYASNLSSSKRRIYVIIDACRNGSDREAAIAAGKAIHDKIKEGMILLFSSQSNAASTESAHLGAGSGVFTYFLLLALKGAFCPTGYKEVTLRHLEYNIPTNVSGYVTKWLDSLGQDPDIYEYDKAYLSETIAFPPQPIIDASREELTSVRHNFPYDRVTQVVHPINNASYATKGIGRQSIGRPNGGPHVIQPSSNPPCDDTKISAPPPSPEETSSDSLETFLYEMVKQSIRAQRLLEPSDSSAYYYYNQLRSRYSASKFLSSAKDRFCIALMTSSQDFLDSYLAGMTIDAQSDSFIKARNELQYADSLLESPQLSATLFRPKIYFLNSAALALSLKPGDWQIGLTAIDSAIDISPGFFASYYIRGLLRFNQDKYYSAAQDFKKAADSLSDWPLAFYKLAETYYKIQEYDKSIQYCHKAIQLDSAYSYPYSLIGLNYERVYQMDSAILYNKIALSINPSNKAACYYLARTYIQRNHRGDLDLAEKYLRLGADQLNDVSCMTMFGQFRLQFKRDSGLYYLEKAHRQNPYNADAVSALAKYYSENVSDGKADSLYAATILMAGSDTKLYSAYRSFLFDFSVERSDSLFREILSFNTEDPQVFLDYSRQFEGIDPRKAKEIIDLGASFNKNTVALELERSRFYFRHLDDKSNWPLALDSSLSILKLLQEENFTDSRINYNLYQIYTLKDQPDLANTFLGIAQQQNQYVAYTDHFGKDLLNSGNDNFNRKDFRSASNYYSLVITLDTLARLDFKMNFLLGKTYYLGNKMDNARYYISQASRLAPSKKDLTACLRIKGLILFDEDKYMEAEDVFSKLNTLYNDSALWEEAVCNFRLGDLSKARQLALLSSSLDSNYFYRYGKNEGVIFSSNFISSMQKLMKTLKILPPSWFSLDDATPTPAKDQNKQILTNISSLLDSTLLGSSASNITVLERGEAYRDSLQPELLKTDANCSGKDILYYQRNLSDSRSRTQIEHAFKNVALTGDFTKDSYINYYFRDNKLIFIDLTLTYSNTVTHNKLLNLFGVDRFNYPKGFFYRNATNFAKVYQETGQHTTHIILGSADEYKSCEPY